MPVVTAEPNKPASEARVWGTSQVRAVEQAANEFRVFTVLEKKKSGVTMVWISGDGSPVGRAWAAWLRVGEAHL